MQKDSWANSTGKPEEQDWVPCPAIPRPTDCMKTTPKMYPHPNLLKCPKGFHQESFPGKVSRICHPRWVNSLPPSLGRTAHLLNTNSKYFTLPVPFIGILWQVDLRVNFKVWFDYWYFLGFLHWFPDTAFLCCPVSSESVEWWFGHDSWLTCYVGEDKNDGHNNCLLAFTKILPFTRHCAKFFVVYFMSWLQ